MRTAARQRLHYGWLVVLGATVAIFACIGLGRFALGMLLPGMGKGLALSYSEMGLVSTLNFAGYLAGVLGCGVLVARLGYRRLITLALCLVGLTMVAVGRATAVVPVYLLYGLTGVGSGAANVPAMALVSHWFGPRLRGRACGLVTSGSGFAILLAGWLVPVLQGADAAAGWRAGWQVLGGLVLAAALIAWLLLRDDPRAMGLAPCGGDGDGGGGRPEPPPLPARRFLHLAAIYFLFGCTYVIYVTFIVTAMVTERGVAGEVAGGFWSVVGALSLASGPLFGGLADRYGRHVGLAMVFGLQALAHGLAAFDLGTAGLVGSVVAFGLTAWAIPAIVAAQVADDVGPARAARLFGRVTFVFALGQILGPAVAGWLAETWNTFTPAFLAAAFLAATGGLLGWRLRRR